MRNLDIVFALTRYHYASYTDFWKLVELSGFESCYVDEIRLSRPAVYITCPMNGEIGPHLNNYLGKGPRNAHVILWCLERPSGAGGVFNYGKSNRKMIYERILDEVWVSDRAMANETMLKFVVCGSDYGLGEPSDHKSYDFVHMSYKVDRRQRVYTQLDEKVIGPNCWGDDRHRVLQRSRFALNIHQDQYPFQEPLRLALFAAYGLPTLTEELRDAYPWNEDIMVFNPYDGIAGRLKEMLDNDYTRWRDMGLRARDHMCKTYRFKDQVIQAVKESLGG